VAGQYDHKKRPGGKQIPEAESGQDKEEQAPETEKAEPEKTQAQSQMGNQAMIAMMASGQLGGGGGGAVEIERARRKHDQEKETPGHGGEDDGGDPGPLTIEDLARSWNPGTRRSEDRPAFLEPMPGDELPPEDEAFLASVHTCADPWPLSPLSSQILDPFLQPSPEVIRIALAPWSRAAGTWAAPSLLAHLQHRLITPTAPVLQDPHGRVLPARARSGAIATCLLLGSPALRADAATTSCATVGFALELAARRYRVRAVQIVSRELEGRALPVARKIFLNELNDEAIAAIAPHRPHESTERVLATILDDLAEWEDPYSLVPALEVQPLEADPDDPLGLDTVMEEMTGGATDPEKPLFDASIHTAERLASAAARSRVLFAGTGVAIAEVAALWSSGAPASDLADVMSKFDREIAGLLQLLVEIARAAHRRSVPPVGLHAGLRRAARSLRKIRTRGTRQLVEVIGGVLPGHAALVVAEPELPDPIRAALSVGQPAEALPWLEAQPPDLDRDTALVLTRAVAGALPTDLLRPLRDIVHRWREERDDVIARAPLEIALGAAALFCGELDEAMEIADRLLDLGRRRRNGLVVAEGALLGMEVLLASGDLAALERRRHRAGHLLWRMGARGALSLLARWTPPEADDEDAA